MQRHDVVIDACLIGGSHSSLLQQACQLTGGIYTRPARPAVLVAYLLVIACSNVFLCFGMFVGLNNALKPLEQRMLGGSSRIVRCIKF